MHLRSKCTSKFKIYTIAYEIYGRLVAGPSGDVITSMCVNCDFLLPVSIQYRQLIVMFLVYANGSSLESRGLCTCL